MVDGFDLMTHLVLEAEPGQGPLGRRMIGAREPRISRLDSYVGPNARIPGLSIVSFYSLPPNYPWLEGFVYDRMVLIDDVFLTCGVFSSYVFVKLYGLMHICIHIYIYVYVYLRLYLL